MDEERGDRMNLMSSVGALLVLTQDPQPSSRGPQPGDVVLEAAEGKFSIPLVYVMECDCIGLTSPKSSVTWPIVAPASGSYTVMVTGARGQGPSAYAVRVGDQTVTGKVADGPPNWCEFADQTLGPVELTQGRSYDVSIAATVMPKTGPPVPLQLRRVILRPARSIERKHELRLHGLFGDHGVLQCEAAAPVWGTAAPGETVTVEIAGQKKVATADANGRWKVVLDPVKAGGPHTMTVSGRSTIAVNDLYFGEVWLCSGQSNMRMGVGLCRDAAAEVAAADYPQIRAFTVPVRPSTRPEREVHGTWKICSPRTAARFSATAYYFAREIHKKRGVPVGILHSSVGATPAEHWTSRRALESDPDLAGMLGASKDPCALCPTWLYNGMIAPLVPYALRGALWYQAESNSGRADQYRKLFAAMIRGWREDWGQDFYFGFVQLPDCGLELGGAWPEMREAQASALSLPRTGMAVTIGLGVKNDLHPTNKQDVGKRLALWALHDVYGMDVVHSGPVCESMKVDGNRAVLSFKNVGGGLVAAGGKLAGFEIAGRDGTFVAAQAAIEGSKVAVWSDRVASPAAVRYAWADDPAVTLFNQEGLPAAPFRTR
jgi:sialate O-acetylesterase